MKFLKYTLIGVVTLIALFVLIGNFLPNEWEVSRKTTIMAKPEQIYPYIADLRQWQQWSPWTTKTDPSLVYTYEGPEMGVGAKQNWTSDSMGKGWLQIREADPQTGIKLELFMDMGRFQSTLQGQIAFAAEGSESTVVTWTDKGDSGNNIIRKWFNLCMDPMMGSQFEEGLSNLKALAESKK